MFYTQKVIKNISGLCVCARRFGGYMAFMAFLILQGLVYFKCTIIKPIKAEDKFRIASQHNYYIFGGSFLHIHIKYVHNIMAMLREIIVKNYGLKLNNSKMVHF